MSAQIITALALSVSFAALQFGLERTDQALAKRRPVAGEPERREEVRPAPAASTPGETGHSSEEWENTFQAIGDIVTIHDQDMRIVRVNKAGCRILGAKPEELIGRHCYEVFRGSHRPCDGCPEMQTLQDSTAHSAEIAHPNLGLTFLVSASPIFDKDRQFKGIVHIAKNITEQQQMASQLRQAQKMEAIGTLAGGIAHDFNNILTALMGYTDLTLVGLDRQNQAYADLQEVKKAGKRAAELVKQILAFSRQGEQELKPVRLSPIIKEALKLLRASLPTTIEIRPAINEETGIVQADPTQVHQLLMNLCTNAAHAMQAKGGVLSVEFARADLTPPEAAALKLPAGPYARLAVGDTGHGIAREIMDRIFDPYFTTKEQGKGTGIGLAVVHGIVAKHHGAITVESKPSRGTTFRVYLPLVVHETESDPLPLSTVIGGQERLLLVDDEAPIIAMEKRCLTALGYRVDAFTDPQQALAVFRGNPHHYDLLVTDMTMPQLTGIQLAQKIIALRPELPVVLCSGHNESINGEIALQLGCKAFLQKPFSSTLVAQTIRRIFDGEEAGGQDFLTHSPRGDNKPQGRRSQPFLKI